MQVDLTQLERPIDIVVGGGIREYTKVERQQQMQQLIELSQSPTFGPYIKAPETLEEIFKNWDWPDIDRLIRSEDEVRKQMAEMAAQQAGGSPPQIPAGGENPQGPQGQGANVPGLPEGGGEQGASGESPRPTPSGNDAGVVEI
jgi:hypothetical protein